MISGCIIWSSLPNAVLFFLMPLGFSIGFAQWITPPSFAMTLMSYALPKLWIQDLFKPLGRISSLLSFSQVVSNNEYFRANWRQLASLVKESNWHYGVVLRYVKCAMYFGLVMEVLRTQCFIKRSHVLYTSSILGWFYFNCFSQL